MQGELLGVLRSGIFLFGWVDFPCKIHPSDGVFFLGASWSHMVQYSTHGLSPFEDCACCTQEDSMQTSVRTSFEDHAVFTGLACYPSGCVFKL